MLKGKLIQVLLMALLAIVMLGAEGCQDEFDEICAFAQEAVEGTRVILNGADKAVEIAEVAVAAACTVAGETGEACVSAKEILLQATWFFAEARSKFVKAELLVAGVCPLEGTFVDERTFTMEQKRHYKREVKELKAWIKKHSGTS